MQDMSRIFTICKIFRIFSRSGDRELQGPPCIAPLCRAGSPDPARFWAAFSIRTVGRGPVPRLRRSHRKHRDAGGLSYCQAPPLSVGQDRQILTRSRSGDRELQRPASRRRGERGRQAPALRGRSSHSVGQDRQILTCSRSGDRELQRPVSRRRGDRGGQAPALRDRSISLATVGRGPVPRQRRTHRKRNNTHYIEKSPTKTLFTAPP